MKTSPLLVTLTVVIAAGLPAAAAEHPLDPLSDREIWRTLVLLRDAGHLDRDTKFSQLTLQEPAKQDVLGWRGDLPDRRRGAGPDRRRRHGLPLAPGAEAGSAGAFDLP